MDSYFLGNSIFSTAATVALSAAADVSIVRVQDVAEMMEVVKVTNAIEKQGTD